MTIKEACEEWGVKEATVWGYIRKGYIPDLKIQDNQILVPHIARPYIIRNLKDEPTSTDIDAKIKKALDKNRYLNAKILGVTLERFVERMHELENSKVIRKREQSNNDYSSTHNFVLCAVRSQSKFNFSISATANINTNVNGTLQVGLINANNTMQIALWILPTIHRASGSPTRTQLAPASEPNTRSALFALPCLKRVKSP